MSGDIRPLFFVRDFTLRTNACGSGHESTGSRKEFGGLARCAESKVPTPDGERNRGDPDFPAGVGDSYRDTSECDVSGQA